MYKTSRILYIFGMVPKCPGYIYLVTLAIELLIMQHRSTSQLPSPRFPILEHALELGPQW
jgi:hypothetical protein